MYSPLSTIVNVVEAVPENITTLSGSSIDKSSSREILTVPVAEVAGTMHV